MGVITAMMIGTVITSFVVRVFGWQPLAYIWLPSSVFVVGCYFKLFPVRFKKV